MNLEEATRQFSQAETPQSDTKTPEPQATEEVGADTEQETVETPSSDTETGTSEASDETYEVSYNGETLNLSIDELKKGYMRERDYRYKRGETSKIEKAAQAKLEKLDNVLNEFEIDIQAEQDWFKTEEAKELKELDSEAYLQRLESLEGKKSRREKALELRNQELQERQQARLAEEYDKLTAAIPDWLDQKTQSEELAAINKILDEVGFTEADKSQLIDHRQYILLRRLAKAEAIMSQDLSSKKVTKPAKSTTPGSAEDQSTSADKQRQEAKARLRKTGKLDDAMAVLRS